MMIIIMSVLVSCFYRCFSNIILLTSECSYIFTILLAMFLNESSLTEMQTYIQTDRRIDKTDRLINGFDLQSTTT